MKIRLHFDIKLQEPILLAGWPGMGNVGVGAVDYLRRHLKAQEFGEIDMHEHFTPEAIVVEQGIAKLPKVPGNAFAFSRSPDLVFFVSEAQVSGPAGLALTNLMVDLAEKFGVSRIFTCAAFAMPIGYRERTRVLGVATNESLRDSLIPHGAEILPQGMISGLNGLLLGVAGARGIGAACLLATIPQYAMSLPNPRGSRALVEALGSLLGVENDLSDFEAPVKQMDAVMSQIEERMRSAFESRESAPGESEEEGMGEAAESGPVGEEEVPGYVMKRLEELFLATARDRANAGRLKDELDRWGLFKLYEDRFLDLFRGGREGGEDPT